MCLHCALYETRLILGNHVLWCHHFSTGPCSLGLVVTCKGTDGGDHMECQRQNNLSPYWTTSLILIILGMIGILIVFSILIMALWKNRTEVGSVAKWISFFSSKTISDQVPLVCWLYCVAFSFCFAALVFPIGFVDEEIGGNPYYLPEQQHIGYAYICFILSILFSVLGHVFINKICFSLQSLNFNDAI